MGELNPLGVDPRYALYDLPERSSGYRLRTLVMGVRRTTYNRIKKLNLCTGEWSVPAARDRAWDVEVENPGSVLVLLGRRVWAAFGAEEFAHVVGRSEPFTLRHDSSGLNRYLLLPHPSGLNREWNDPASVDRARALLREVSPETPWGELTG